LQVSIRRGRIGKVITDCKTEHSQRLISVPDDLVEVLAQIPRTVEGNEWVFKGRHGKLPVDVHTFRRSVWIPKLAEAELPPLVIHGARHTWATVALSSGIPLAQVAAHLGDTMKVVERTYAHVLPRFDINAAVGRTPRPPRVIRAIDERPRLRLVKG